MNLKYKFIKHFHKTKSFSFCSNVKTNTSSTKNKEILTFEKFKEIFNDIRLGEIEMDEFPELIPIFEDMFNIGIYPDEPDPYECCGSGCDNCVIDVYHTNLDKFEEGQKELYLKMKKIHEENKNQRYEKI